jgi:uncharacterized protein (TIGR02147 family)
MASIFDYLDYREFLRDYYKEKKKESPFFSYRFIGKRVGMDSSYIIKVLQGSLHIATGKIAKFIELLSLGETEADYFEALVHFCRAKTERQRKLYFDKLFSMSTIKSLRLDAHQYEFFQKWFYSAVWSIINCKPFDGDFRRLAQRCLPAITVWDAKRAVRLLERLGLIAKKEDGCYHTTDLNLTTGHKWHSYAIEGFQREIIGLAAQAIGRSAKEERDLSTVTLSVANGALPEIQEHIRQFRSSLIKLVNSHGGTDRVYQLNVQLFPISTDLKEKT